MPASGVLICVCSYSKPGKWQSGHAVEALICRICSMSASSPAPASMLCLLYPSITSDTLSSCFRLLRPSLFCPLLCGLSLAFDMLFALHPLPSRTCFSHHVSTPHRLAHACMASTRSMLPCRFSNHAFSRLGGHWLRKVLAERVKTT